MYNEYKINSEYDWKQAKAFEWRNKCLNECQTKVKLNV